MRLAAGIGLGLGVGLGRGGRVLVKPDIYVDSVNGLDSNNGLTPATALQTLAAAQAAVLARGNGTILGLAAGSTWREKLAFGSTLRVTVTIFGTGSAPVLIATDVATGWTQPDAANYPNVWYLPAWISECTTNQFPLSVYEDEKQLVNTASLAACNTTPGTSFITTTPDGNDALYIHATGGGNPNSNGKAYEATKRQNCIQTYTGADIDLNFTLAGPIETVRSPWLSGNLVSAKGATFKKALARDGSRGMFLSSGTVEDVVFSGLSNRTNAATSNMLVFYASSPAGTYTGTVKRCGFVSGPNPDQTTYESTAALFSHNDQSGVIHNCTTEQCWVVGIESMGGFRGVTHRHTALYSKNSGCLNVEAATTPAAVVVEYGLFNGGIAIGQLSSWDSVHDFRHCVSYDHKVLRTGDGFKVQNCVWFKSGAQNALTQPIGGGVPNLSVNNSIVIAGGWNYAVDMIALTSYTGNNNIFASFTTGRQARFRYNGVENNSAGATQYKLKWWQDQTGQDANSVYILPSDQVAGGANALWLAYAQAAGGTNLATIGPAVGDFRINPNARVYSGADVAYIGTFPDGLPLVTNVGPQYHWNWNTKSVASGPPERWPVVPESLADSRTYIAAPKAWNFYP